MMKLPSIKLRTIVVSVLSLGLLGLVLYGSTLVDTAAVERLAAQMGPAGQLLIIALVMFTQIFAPLSGAVFLLVGIKIYGYLHALVLFYIASMCSAVIDFMIARRYGRPVVRRLVGDKALARIDEISAVDVRNLLIASRIFGYYFFDIISYALGFTAVGFRKYLAYTAVFSVIPIAAQYVAFRNTDMNAFSGVVLYYGSVFLSGLIFLQIFYRLYVPSRGPGADALVTPETTASAVE